MKSTPIRNATRNLAEDQDEYESLMIRDEPHPIGEYLSVPSMSSLWQPSSDEVAQIINGQPIKLKILGIIHPPVMITVGDPE